ncbi:MAG: hypothetical protein AAGF31_11960, partial [Planctomycetota bacterium]
GARIVFEAKDAGGYSRTKILDELETARKNRRADVGVFVFGSASAPAGLRALSRYRNDLIVVWDAEDAATDAYLLAALEIARACSIEFGRVKEGAAVDVDAIEEAINAVEKRAGNFDKIRKPAETIQSASQKIIDEVRIGQADLERQVKKLRDKLDDLRTQENA